MMSLEQEFLIDCIENICSVVDQDPAGSKFLTAIRRKTKLLFCLLIEVKSPISFNSSFVIVL